MTDTFPRASAADQGSVEDVDGAYAAGTHQSDVFRACEPLIQACALG